MDLSRCVCETLFTRMDSNNFIKEFEQLKCMEKKKEFIIEFFCELRSHIDHCHKVAEVIHILIFYGTFPSMMDITKIKNLHEECDNMIVELITNSYMDFRAFSECINTLYLDNLIGRCCMEWCFHNVCQRLLY